MTRHARMRLIMSHWARGDMKHSSADSCHSVRLRATIAVCRPGSAWPTKGSLSFVTGGPPPPYSLSQRMKEEGPVSTAAGMYTWSLTALGMDNIAVAAAAGKKQHTIVYKTPAKT